MSNFNETSKYCRTNNTYSSSVEFNSKIGVLQSIKSELLKFFSISAIAFYSILFLISIISFSTSLVVDTVSAPAFMISIAVDFLLPISFFQIASYVCDEFLRKTITNSLVATPNRFYVFFSKFIIPFAFISILSITLFILFGFMSHDDNLFVEMLSKCPVVIIFIFFSVLLIVSISFLIRNKTFTIFIIVGIFYLLNSILIFVTYLFSPHNGDKNSEIFYNISNFLQEYLPYGLKSKIIQSISYGSVDVSSLFYYAIYAVALCFVSFYFFIKRDVK